MWSLSSVAWWDVLSHMTLLISVESSHWYTGVSVHPWESVVHRSIRLCQWRYSQCPFLCLMMIRIPVEIVVHMSWFSKLSVTQPLIRLCHYEHIKERQFFTFYSLHNKRMNLIFGLVLFRCCRNLASSSSPWFPILLFNKRSTAYKQCYKIMLLKKLITIALYCFPVIASVMGTYTWKLFNLCKYGFIQWTDKRDWIFYPKWKW